MTKIITFNDFLNIYGKNYPSLILHDIKRDFYRGGNYDAILQIKSKLNMIPSENDQYQGFIKHLRQAGLLKNRILEVGSGYYPILAERIQKQPEIIEITGMDPKLITTNLPNINLFKEKFRWGIDFRDYDLIIGLHPCEATLDIIELANFYNKPFSIVLCSCNHHFECPEAYLPLTQAKWENLVIEAANSTLDTGAILTQTHFEENYNVKGKILTKTYPK